MSDEPVGVLAEHFGGSRMKQGGGHCGDQYQHTVGYRVPAALSGVGSCSYSGKLYGRLILDRCLVD